MKQLFENETVGAPYSLLFILIFLLWMKNAAFWIYNENLPNCKATNAKIIKIRADTKDYLEKGRRGTGTNSNISWARSFKRPWRDLWKASSRALEIVPKQKKAYFSLCRLADNIPWIGSADISIINCGCVLRSSQRK